MNKDKSKAVEWKNMIFIEITGFRANMQRH